MIEPRNGLQKILVFPRGEFFIEKYNDWVTFDDKFFNQIIDAYNSDSIKKPFIDKNHELKDSFGDISNPSIEDQGLFFEAVLTPTGVELIRDRIYTSISPTFGEFTDNQGKKWPNVLVSVSLTNVPALQTSLPELQTQMSLSITSGGLYYFNFSSENLEKGEKQMKNLEVILRKLELSPEASDIAITEAIQKLIDDGVTKEQLIASLTKKLEEVQAMADSAAAEANEAKAEVEMMKDENVKKEFESVFVESLKSGKVLPAEKDKFFNLFKTDKDFTVNMLKKLSIVSENIVSIGNQVELSDEDKAAMKLARLNPDNPKDVEFFKSL